MLILTVGIGMTRIVATTMSLSGSHDACVDVTSGLGQSDQILHGDYDTTAKVFRAKGKGSCKGIDG